VTDPAHPKALGKPLTTSNTDGISSVTFMPDGRAVASGSEDHMTQLWNLNANYAIERICATTANNLTPKQWHKYIPQLPYRPPCRH
jgi:WD40 repeat protein